MNKIRKSKEINSLSSIINQDNKFLREKLLKKIPRWLGSNEIELPQSISIEQSSSEETAIIKSTLVKYDLMIDLTGGFGIDSYFFSLQAKQVFYIEKDKALFQLVNRNFNKMNIKNVNFINDFAENFLNKIDYKVDLIYCDPSRRVATQKVYKLEESEPNIFEIIDTISDKSRFFLLKTSPFLDIQLVINKLDNIVKVILISIENELKEILYLFDFEKTSKIKYETYLINRNYCTKMSFDNLKYEVKYDDPQKYLYEPDNAILKLGNFTEIAHQFNLSKIEASSHLYTSIEINNTFPGKIYKILDVTKIDGNELNKFSESRKFNLKIRNFPDTVENLKRKLKIQDGGDLYIFATKLKDKKYKLIICEKAII